jgi:GntR family transcriptional regulator/MocR family aminotransferase
VTARHAPLLEQAVLCDFIAEGHFGRHIRSMREIYAERLAALLESARESLHGLMEVSNIEAGLQTVGWLEGGVTAEAATQAAAERGLEMIPLSRFSLRQMPREGVQLGFAAVDPGEIRRGVRELSEVLRKILKR